LPNSGSVWSERNFLKKISGLKKLIRFPSVLDKGKRLYPDLNVRCFLIWQLFSKKIFSPFASSKTERTAIRKIFICVMKTLDVIALLLVHKIKKLVW